MIHATGLGICFDTAGWLFRNISFEVKKSKSLAVVGPSGSGKTVLLKCLAGLIDPSEGSVKLQSKDIGMLFQKNALFDSLTAADNLRFVLKERNGIVGPSATRAIDHWLQAVGLDGSQHKMPSQLSGGMQKRLGIARALCAEPEVIFYDDPTAGLDPITSRVIADLIARLRNKSGTTLIAVTGDLFRAEQLGDQVSLLAQGRLTPGCPPHEFKSSQDPAIRQFVLGQSVGPLTDSQAAR